MRLLVSLALLAFAVPAHAQDMSADTGSILRRPAPAAFDGSAKGGVKVRAALDQFAYCIFDRRRGQTLAALRLASGSEQQDKALASLARSECVSAGILSFDAQLFRGSLYKALVREHFADSDAALPQTQIDFAKQTEAQSGGEKVLANAQLLNFGGCVAHLDPRNVRLAVLGPAGSPSEAAAFSALSPNLGQCLPQDVTLKFDKTILLGLLAEAYYREATLQPPSEAN